MTKLEPLKSGYYVWHYVPSIAAAIIFIILFLVLSLHIISGGFLRRKFDLPFLSPLEVYVSSFPDHHVFWRMC